MNYATGPSQISKQPIKTYMRVLRLPKAVQVAVCVDSICLVSLAEGEADLRSLAGLQDFALASLLGNRCTN